MNTRRALLKKMGLTVAAASAMGAGVVPGDAQATRREAITALTTSGSSDAPWWLLSPLQVGSAVGLGWSVVALSPVSRGASVLSLSHRDGRQAQVHLCAHAGHPRGLAHSALLDLILMDGGQGDRRTDEDLGRALLSLADRIRRNEVSEAADLRPLAHLMSHAERVSLYGAEGLA